MRFSHTCRCRVLALRVAVASYYHRTPPSSFLALLTLLEMSMDVEERAQQALADHREGMSVSAASRPTPLRITSNPSREAQGYSTSCSVVCFSQTMLTKSEEQVLVKAIIWGDRSGYGW